MRRLKADELRAACDPSTLPLRSTGEFLPLEEALARNGERLRRFRTEPAR